MKVSSRSLLAVVVTLVAMLALLSGASAQPELASASGPGRPNWSALDKVGALKDGLNQAGFSLTEGSFTYVDLVQLTCQGKVPDTLANNPWPNAYMALSFDPRPGVAAPPVTWLWQLGENEAVVFVGQTPPGVRYFSYQTAVNIMGGSTERLGAMVGDTINIGTMRTLGPDKTDQPIVYIITGNRGTERAVRQAVRKAGYPDAIVNVETISRIIAPLGVGPNGSWFYTAHRSAVPDPEARQLLEEYVKHPPYAVFRVTPDEALAAELGDDAEPPPVLRVRGTGHTEMALYPALHRLRAAILEQHGERSRKELDTKVWELPDVGGREMKVEKPYVALQRGIQVIGATRDTNYLANYPNFMLRSDVDEFVIVYGVNHEKTGKATYSSFSIYADKDRWYGLKNGTTLSPDFEGSADQYLPGDPDAQYLYAYKVARNCEGEKYCMEVKVNDDPALPFSDIDDVPYACPGFSLDTSQMFFLWRSYMEPATNVGPDDNELLYDRAIYFGPYFAEQ